MTERRSFQKLTEKMMADPVRRARVEEHKRELVAEIIAYKLQEMRKMREVTQQEVATALGIGQPGVSRLENGNDPHLSTIREYVEALGGRLELTAVFGGERVPLDL
jgi:DNA-binding XRE family transcriptional regulator